MARLRNTPSWSPAEIEAMRAATEAGERDGEIVAALRARFGTRRSIGAVRSKRHSLRARAGEASPARAGFRTFGPASVELTRRMARFYVHDGLSLALIARACGVGETAVYNRLQKHGVDTSGRARRRMLSRFALLVDLAAGRTAKEIANGLGIARSRVSLLARGMGVSARVRPDISHLSADGLAVLREALDLDRLPLADALEIAEEYSAPFAQAAE